MTINVALAGAGAFGIKHLDAIRTIDDVRVVSIVDRTTERAQEVADEYNIGHVTSDLAESLALDEVHAVVLATPTPMHAAQAIACLDAGKHVEVEIPMCDNLADGRRVIEAQQRTGLVAMCGHTRRFNPSHQWVNRRVQRAILQFSTWMFRRTFSVGRTPMRSASRVVGLIICCGITRPIRLTCSHTKLAVQSLTPTSCRGRSTPNSELRWTCRSSYVLSQG